MPKVSGVESSDTLAYNQFPRKAAEKKKELIESACAEKAIVAFTHDERVTLGRVHANGDNFRVEAIETLQETSKESSFNHR